MAVELFGRYPTDKRGAITIVIQLTFSVNQLVRIICNIRTRRLSVLRSGAISSRSSRLNTARVPPWIPICDTAYQSQLTRSPDLTIYEIHSYLTCIHLDILCYHHSTTLDMQPVVVL